MRRRATILVGLGAVLWGALATPAGAHPAAVIEISSRGLLLDRVDVLVGAEVEWRHLSDEAYTVTADDGSFDSGELEPGDSFDFTFEAPGVYTYRAVGAAGGELTGTVFVSEAGRIEEPTPPGGRDASSGAVGWSFEAAGVRPGEEEPAPSGPVSPGGSSPKTPPSDRSREPIGPEASVGRSAPLGLVLAQASVTVTVVDNDFNPREVDVDRGGTVTWNQTGELPHTVTADDGSFDSGEIGPGDSFSHTFSQPGTFAYFCEFHGAPGGVGMSGTVVVSGAGGNGAPSGGAGVGGEGGTDQGTTQVGGLAETGASAGTLSATVLALLVVGSACLVIERRRRPRVERVTGFEREALFPGRST